MLQNRAVTSDLADDRDAQNDKCRSGFSRDPQPHPNPEDEPAGRARYAAGEKLGAEITALCGNIYAKTYRLLELIREFDEKGYWQLPGLCSTAHWLNWQCGIGMNAAREKVRVARALPDLPKISEAFRKGEVSYSKVRAMTRVADAQNEDYLLGIARHGTAYHVEGIVAKYRRAKRLQDAANANFQYEMRSVEHYYDDDGALVLKARLPAEVGALLLKALDKAMDHQFNADDDVHVGGPSGPISSPATDVSAETPEPDPDPEPTRYTFPQRRADALAEMAETYLAHGARDSSSADRYQVVVHVSAEMLDSHVGGPSGPIHSQTTSQIENAHHVSAETSRRLACDCSVLGLVEDADGEPLSIGRKSRSISPAIRRALRIRDKGCRFPGCTRKAYLDGHHIRHWSDGGETSLDNLVLLCRHHHRLVHEGGFDCEKSDDGEVVFRDARRQRIDRYARLTPEEERRAFDVWLEREMRDLGITSQTCVTRWEGERMDWDLGVGHLFPREAAAG
ncbi:HNH endonuclease signature motif containing protein [Lentisalinibacter salinarum]|uniref:HNH endonuclease signature motif containing protein n=1 Tax=Lentisalinibacter salinarum TaxID=2992239 RepID=UPI003870C4AB